MYKTTIDSCISQELFGDEIIIKIFFSKQNIPILKENAISNLDDLELLSFLNCNINFIERGAFKNLPKLKRLVLEFNKITELLNKSFLRLNINEINLNFNNLDIIRSESFKNLSSLTYFTAKNNFLSQYNSDWFCDSPNLKRITLTNNKLHVIPRRAFYHNVKLRIIEFDYNEISTIERDAFEGLTNLTRLKLTNNRIKLLKANSFATNTFIQLFTIDLNKLNYLENDLMVKLTVEEIYLYGNPWKCECFNKIENWCGKYKVKINKLHQFNCPNSPLCVLPKINNVTECVEKYDDESVRHFYNEVRMLGNVNYCFKLDES